MASAPAWLGTRSEAAGAASVGGASRALGPAVGALAGRVQPERRHVSAPLQRKASEGSPLGSVTRTGHRPGARHRSRHLPAAPGPCLAPFLLSPQPALPGQGAALHLLTPRGRWARGALGKACQVWKGQPHSLWLGSCPPSGFPCGELSLPAVTGLPRLTDQDWVPCGLPCPMGRPGVMPGATRKDPRRSAHLEGSHAPPAVALGMGDKCSTPPPSPVHLLPGSEITH